MGASMSPVGSLIGGLQSVGSLVSTVAPLVGGISQITNDIRGLSGQDAQYEAARRAQLAAQQQLAMAQLQAQQQMQESQDAQGAAQIRQEMIAEASEAERSRRAALKRAVARQKVSLAAQGVSGADDGSSEAILLRLFQESDEDRVARERLDGLRSAALEQELGHKRSLNVLQRSQLAERQRLERALLA